MEDSVITAEGGKERDEIVRMKSNLLATMSHEMRTPMQSVFGFLELMLYEDPSPSMKYMIEQAMSSVSGVLEILDDILDVAKIDADKMVLDHFELPVRTLVRGVLEALEPKVAQKNVRLLDEISDDVPKVVMGDPKRLRQILINLAGNAVKFTAEGHVLIRVFVAQQSPLRLRFEVIDTGIGLTEEAQQKLFQPFVQADSSTSREYGGTGLGLSICRKLVDLMGGEIGVTSVRQHGTTFWFEAPLPEPDADAETGILPDLTGLSVLSAEDHPQAAREIVSALSSMGARVESCKSAVEARTILAHRPFDVVVSDQSLGDGLTGLDLLRFVAERWPRTGLVMYTARDDTGLRQSLQTIGADYLEKPASRRGLGESVAGVAARQITCTDIKSGKILVVEDTDSVREMFMRQFRLLGVNADYAVNGIEAMALIDSGDYDLILTDLHMPRMDGYALIKEIRERENQSGQHIPVVLLTADIQMSGYRSYMPLGFDEGLLKPVSLGALRQMLVRWNVPFQKGAVLPRADSGDSQSYPSLDLDVLREQMGEIDAAACEMLARFPEMMAPLMQKIEAACSAGDSVALCEYAHSMKGAARSAGAMSLGQLAAAIQEHAQKEICDAGLCQSAADEFRNVALDIGSLCARCR